MLLALYLATINQSNLDIINILTFILMGAVFLYYGVTGRSKLFVWREK